MLSLPWRVSDRPVSAVLRKPEPLYRPVRAAENITRAARQRRNADLALAIPDGAVIGILPKFGWLLYEGHSHEGERHNVSAATVIYGAKLANQHWFL